MGRRHTREELREAMTRSVNSTRDTADEMALRFDGCDDSLHPHGPQVFRDWVDFVDRVARPLVEAEDDREAEQAAMALYRKASPYSICVSMVMMANRLAADTETPEAAALREHYVSTYCLHSLHSECRLTCKTCNEACRCTCGHPSEGGAS